MLEKPLLVVALTAVFASALNGENGSYSDFLLLTDTCDEPFTDGTVLNGPVRSNDSLLIISLSPGRDGDPWFYSLSTAEDSIYTVLPGSAEVVSSVHPHPVGSNLWVEPYEQMIQGPPWFNLGVPRIPFGSDSVDWQSTRDAAMASGYYFPPDSLDSGTRILLEASRLHIKEDWNAQPQTRCVFEVGQPVIWIDNDPEDVIYIKTIPPAYGIGIFTPMTIGCNGDIYLMGPLEYESGYNGMLGLMTSHGDLIIADKPASEPWDGAWTIETDEDMVFSGSFLTAQGTFSAENTTEPYPAVECTVFGGVQTTELVLTSAEAFGETTGFLTEFEFDTRLFSSSPPNYPLYDVETGIESSGEAVSHDDLLSVGQNPFSHILSVSWTGRSAEPMEISLLDMSGRLVLRSRIQDRQEIFTGSLASGTYILLLASPGGDYVECKKVVKI